jgi:serine phosphatase RsbU (regulator of sigma subunit)
MLSIEEAGQFLRKCIFFSDTSDAIIQELADLAELIRLPAGSTLFEKGDTGFAMYFVVEGCVRIHSGSVVITHLDKGQVFGEVAALSNELRTASVTAEMDTVLLKLEQEAIYATLATQPEVAKSIIQALCKRERQIIDEKFDRMVKAKVLENELDIGQRIQKNFLPEVIPEVDGWRINGLLQPARKVAGDFYDFFMIPRLQCIGIVIGDVCDKGVGAALFMTLFRSLIRSSALYRCTSEEQTDCADLISILQHAIRSTNKYIASTHSSSSMFASVFFGLLVPETGQLCYINAGHEAPCICGPTGIRLQLHPTGPVIGLFEGAQHKIGMAEIFSSEVLFGYTDGATDAQNKAGEQYTEDRLLSTIGLKSRNGAAVMHDLFSDVVNFIGEADQYDDITMISIYREPT